MERSCAGNETKGYINRKMRPHEMEPSLQRDKSHPGERNQRPLSNRRPNDAPILHTPPLVPELYMAHINPNESHIKDPCVLICPDNDSHPNHRAGPSLSPITVAYPAPQLQINKTHRTGCEISSGGTPVVPQIWKACLMHGSEMPIRRPFPPTYQPPLGIPGAHGRRLFASYPPSTLLPRPDTYQVQANTCILQPSVADGNC